MGIILDLILVAIVLVFVYFSAKHGFVRTIVELAGFFIAIYLSLMLSGALSDVIYDGLVHKPLTESVSNSVESTSVDSINDAVETIWNSMPKFVTSAADNFGVSKQSVANQISSASSSGKDAVVSTTVDYIAKPIIVNVIKACLFLLLFVVLTVLVKILAKIINQMFNLPLIGGLNRGLGGVLGLFKGIIMAAAFCILISICITFTDDGFLIFTKENIDSSFIFKFLCGLNPLN